MATSQKPTEHFLTCTICTEMFDNPCTLVCNHTFCRKCVVNYTKTRPEAIRAKSRLCPFCNKMTKVSAPERPVEEWADDVKPPFIIQGLLDSFGPGSKGTNLSRAKGELDLKATPVLHDTIYVRVAGDSYTSYPSDVTVMVVNDTDTVVVTDWNNNNVKSFYTRNNQTRHSKLSLGGRPWGLTKLTHNQVAITLMNIKQIVTVEVNPDLVLLSTIKTVNQYWGITSLTESTLAAGSRSPLCVDILDILTENVLWSIIPTHKGNNILQHPNFLCTTRTGNILVSDQGSKCVACLTPKGDLVFTYSPTGDTALKYPQGITSTSTGDILVTDHSLDSVIHLTESGQFVRTKLTQQDGINHPEGVCVDGHGHVYVGMRSEGVIKVFTCKH